MVLSAIRQYFFRQNLCNHIVFPFNKAGCAINRQHEIHNGQQREDTTSPNSLDTGGGRRARGSRIKAIRATSYMQSQ